MLWLHVFLSRRREKMGSLSYEPRGNLSTSQMTPNVDITLIYAQYCRFREEIPRLISLFTPKFLALFLDYLHLFRVDKLSDSSHNLRVMLFHCLSHVIMGFCRFQTN